MSNLAFADLTSGYEKFDALAKNLEGIFDKVNAISEYKIDISYYEKKFNEPVKNIVSSFSVHAFWPFFSRAVFIAV